MATILIKNLPEDLLKKLKRLKIELGCRTWADLLAQLTEAREPIILSEEEMEKARTGVQNFLRIRNTVSSKWIGHPTALEETRRMRRHEAD